jgi:Uma2 family endonuclease
MGTAMASTTPTTRLLTGEELARMPVSDACELVAGRIVPVSPGGVDHSLATANAFRMLDGFVRPRRLGRVLTGELGVYTRRDPDTVRGADVVFISTERYARRTVALTFLDVAPELVVEVLSARDSVMDLTDKLHEYFAAGARMVWVVAPRARRVYVHRSVVDVREVGEGDTLPGDDVLPEFTAPVAALFEA